MSSESVFLFFVLFCLLFFSFLLFWPRHFLAAQHLCVSCCSFFFKVTSVERTLSHFYFTKEETGGGQNCLERVELRKSMANEEKEEQGFPFSFKHLCCFFFIFHWTNYHLHSGEREEMKKKEASFCPGSHAKRETKPVVSNTMRKERKEIENEESPHTHKDIEHWSHALRRRSYSALWLEYWNRGANKNILYERERERKRAQVYVCVCGSLHEWYG